MIRKNKNKYEIYDQLIYEMGSSNLNSKENNTYVDEVVKIIRKDINGTIKNIYFNIQNDEIIIRNMKNLQYKRKKEVVQLIKYEINNYMPINLQNYEIKFKKIINTKGKGSIQGILFPKKYVDICKSISEELKIKKKYLYINFDILQKLIDLKVIYFSENQLEKINIIENRHKDLILNTVINSKIIESYVIDKFNRQDSMNQFLYDTNTYYYGISDDFIESLKIKKLDIKNKLSLSNKSGIMDVTLEYLSALGMII